MSISEGHSALPEPSTSEVGEYMYTKENSKEDSNGGIQLDSIGHLSQSPDSIIEESDEIASLAKPLSSGRESKKKHSSVIIRMTTNDSNPPSTPKSPLSRRGTGLSRIRKTLFHKDSGLSVQESWRKKNATVRLKNSKNFVSFHNIYYTIPQGYFWQRKPPKVILNNVSGIMRSGVNAIMGPSGSGKSTLLDILADRKDRRWVTGHVLINGEKQPHNFKCACGYVVQDDILTGTLTVKENVYLSALLRLPPEMDKDEKLEKVDEVIEELGISHVADTLIGTAFTRGISGGQRKRTSIARELVVSPGVLFLDEPTTGLDSTTAESVIQILHNLSKEGRVIIMSIHQPRYSIFRLCDHLMLLSRGVVVYTGVGRATLPYFTNTLGVECDEFENPADFFLDNLNETENASDPETGDIGHPLGNKWCDSEDYQILTDELNPLLDKAIDQPDGIAPKYATNPLTQTYYLFGRGMKKLLRDPIAGVVVWLQNIALGVFAGVIFYQLGDEENALLDRSGAIFFCMLCNLFTVATSLGLFVNERALFIHENSSGFYRVSSYFFSKIFGDLIPLRLLPVPFFSAIAYWMIGLQAEVGKFLLFMLGIFAQNMTAAGLVYSISAAVGTFSVAQIIYIVLLVFAMIFGGFFVSLNTVPSWVTWLQWLSYFKYTYAILLENELENTEFTYCARYNGTVCLFTTVEEGNDYLENLNFHQYNIYWNFLGLGLLALALFILTYIFLLRIKKTT
ncbi:broad substrate specificity ATP-binding cassette transporter ABCG2-like isoform X3 [Dysidea avara]|uniref:broad substrate specificity ATP-binding cassette transporter ABCG2-like isoform X3 n=1 Tax=Dysidea avara TaxID=196820 RepID=UPI0033310C87